MLLGIITVLTVSLILASPKAFSIIAITVFPSIVSGISYTPFGLTEVTFVITIALSGIVA